MTMQLIGYRGNNEQIENPNIYLYSQVSVTEHVVYSTDNLLPISFSIKHKQKCNGRVSFPSSGDENVREPVFFILFFKSFQELVKLFNQN